MTVVRRPAEPDRGLGLDREPGAGSREPMRELLMGYVTGPPGRAAGEAAPPGDVVREHVSARDVVREAGR